MNNHIKDITLMGRLAYILMCIEKFLVNVYPKRDWQLLSKAFWAFSRLCISNWMYFYGELTPDIVLHDGKYNRDIQQFFTQ